MPLVESPGLGQGILLKLESVQPAVSFKVRGALAAPSATGNTGGIVTITVILIRQHFRRLISVTEEHIGDAIRHLASEHGLIAVGAGPLQEPPSSPAPYRSPARPSRSSAAATSPSRRWPICCKPGSRPATRTSNPRPEASTRAGRHNWLNCAAAHPADATARRTYSAGVGGVPRAPVQ
jgi:hypothetical protein